MGNVIKLWDGPAGLKQEISFIARSKNRLLYLKRMVFFGFCCRRRIVLFVKNKKNNMKMGYLFGGKEKKP